MGLTRADDTLVPRSATLPDGTAIFERASGYGFSIIVEGRPGGTGTDIGLSAFDSVASDPTVLPDLQIEASRPLGNGSKTVCDDALGMFGGVPATDPASFAPVQAIADAINDFACRFKDDTGSPGGRGRGQQQVNPCVLFPDGQYNFAGPTSTAEFCGLINQPFSFPTGDTLVTARLRDLNGRLSATRQIIIRVLP